MPDEVRAAVDGRCCPYSHMAARRRWRARLLPAPRRAQDELRRAPACGTVRNAQRNSLARLAGGGWPLALMHADGATTKPIAAQFSPPHRHPREGGAPSKPTVVSLQAKSAAVVKPSSALPSRRSRSTGPATRLHVSARSPEKPTGSNGVRSSSGSPSPSSRKPSPVLRVRVAAGPDGAASATRRGAPADRCPADAVPARALSSAVTYVIVSPSPTSRPSAA